MKKLVIFLSFILGACSSNQLRYGKGNLMTQYTGPYCVIVTFFPHNSHPINIAGGGHLFKPELLDRTSLGDYLKTFYTHLAYFPLYINDLDYKTVTNCLGYDISLDTKNSDF